MSGPTDAELLSDWLDRQREPAFHALVDRYAGLVHMAARRTTAGDDSLAAEASQLAFITLARKARSLTGRSSLAGWLHATAVLQARNLLRQRAREIRKLQILRTHMEHESQASPAADWQRVQPVLDEALAALSTKDRETLLLRFYRSLSVREIGAALGIATDAAQKRLDRATEKLRGQLARRGCQVGGSLGVVLLTGFTADAKGAAIPSSSMLASNALTAAGAGSTATLTTIGIIAMTKKAAITAGVVVLLAGAGTAVFLNQNKEQAAPSGPAAPTKSASTHPTTTSGLAPTESTAKSERPKGREAADDSALVTKYGESRTNLSKHVATQLIGVLEDAVAMGELAMSDQNAAMFGGRRGGMRGAIGGDLSDKLAMTDEQQEKAGEIFKEYQKRELAKTKESVESMKKDPTALMTLMLASDAQSNGKMTADEFKEVQASISDDLKGTINPLDRKNFQGGQPMKDATFRSEMAAILEPDQAETFKSAAAEQEAKKADDRSMNNLPSMKLEEMDTTVSSAKKMTSGMKSMMEGMGGLGPLMEMEKKKREAEEAAKAAAEGTAPAVPATPAGQ
ncbi:RNA polymerase sigma factor [Haloferula sp. BvORR071]|uniref:RNA polymerase sigma factor n=1 Tax=Haloferula sp. BvORR071 TaxID=1396141 RepID=UPI000558A7CB|nr:RNA polymerase sigma factor [Haloferula sp. BvORR071]